MKAVNLLPSDLRGTPSVSAGQPAAGPDVPRGPGAFVVLATLACGVVALAGYVVAGNTVKERKAELSQLEQRVQTATQRAAALKPYAEFEQLSQARAATVRDLAGRRLDWEHALRDLSRALPADVTLTELSGSISSANGSDTSQLRNAISAPAISLHGCTKGQTSVARLMARLRDVDGVTRVTLASSDKKDDKATNAGAAADSASIGGEQPCGTGDRPEFEIEAFFERASQSFADPSAPATGTLSAGATTQNASATRGTSSGSGAGSSNGGQTAQASGSSTIQGGTAP